MPDRCVVVGCSGTPNAEKEIALHKIPFFGDHRSEAKARRKNWADFLKLKRAKLTATASSALCSCHFAPEDFAPRHCFGGLKQQWTLIKDEIGILTIPRLQRNTFEEEEFTLRTRRQVSVHACCFGLVSLYQCEMPTNLDLITYFATRSNWITDSWWTCCAVLRCVKPNEGLCGLCKTKRWSQAVEEQMTPNARACRGDMAENVNNLPCVFFPQLCRVDSATAVHFLR